MVWRLNYEAILSYFTPLLLSLIWHIDVCM